jgi:hypothetical protein
MPKSFEELMQEFQNPGENGIPETFVTELQETYQNDLSIRDAAIAEREQQLADAVNAQAERDAEINRLKAVNYDLIQSAPKAGNPAPNEQPDGGAAQGGIESLFDRKTL